MLEDAEQPGDDDEVADAHDVAERPRARDRDDVPEREQVGVGDRRGVGEVVGGSESGEAHGALGGGHDPVVGDDGEGVQRGAEGEDGQAANTSVGEDAGGGERVGRDV